MIARLGAAILALAAGVGGVVVAVLLLQSEPGPVSSGATTAAPAVTTTVAGGQIPTPTDPGFPAPPPGALVLAREAGTRALALAIVPGDESSLVRVSVLSGQGPGARGLAVSILAGGQTVLLPACGAGCYQSDVPTSRLSGKVVVMLDARGYPFTLPSTLSLPAGTAMVANAGKVWRALKTLVWHERLAASPTDALYTVYRAVAPDELQYTIGGHSSALIIGMNRWDRATPTGRWVHSVQNPPITQPQPFWAGQSDAHVIASGRVDGRSAAEITFFDPVTPAWFDAWIDKRNGHTLVLTMTAVAHFMHHVYGPFDAPFQLHPPAA
ncbi:MAG TPA: hypothetical protein VH063_04965 [Gaiellaceae bacterium]|nr:hypothetical protein [Gaiellaceae bacterium]